jgi:hypothetical protein
MARNCRSPPAAAAGRSTPPWRVSKAPSVAMATRLARGGRSEYAAGARSRAAGGFAPSTSPARSSGCDARNGAPGAPCAPTRLPGHAFLGAAFAPAHPSIGCRACGRRPGNPSFRSTVGDGSSSDEPSWEVTTVSTNARDQKQVGETSHAPAPRPIDELTRPSPPAKAPKAPKPRKVERRRRGRRS